jgi:DNA-binding Lrp family transcriptional regulator
MAKVDQIDSIILRELLYDGRTSFTNIAKQCDLTKGAIAKRYEKLKKTGIIVGSTIQIDPQKFGYNAAAYINTNTEPKYLDSLFEYLNTIPELRNYRCYTSPYNLNTIVGLKQLKDLQNIKFLISKRCPVNEIKTYLWIEVRNIPENIFPNFIKKKTEDNLTIKQKATDKPLEKLDKLDLQIVEILNNNSRIPFRKIANTLETTTNTIIKRYENLRSNYLKPTIQISTIKLGFNATLHIYLSLSEQDKTSTIIENLSKILGIVYIVKISGDYDLQVAAIVKDYNDTTRIYKEIAQITQIKKIDMRILQLRINWPGPRQHISTF